MKVRLESTERYPWVSEVSERDAWRSDFTVEIADAAMARYRQALREFESAYRPILAAYKRAEHAREIEENAERIKSEQELTPCEGCGQSMTQQEHQSHRPWCAPLVWPTSKT